MMLAQLGLEGPLTTSTPIPTDDSDNAIPAGGDTAIAAGSRGFSDPAAVITTSTPILTDDSDNAISVSRNTATAPVAVITPIPTDDSDNAISVSRNTVTAPVAVITPSPLTTATRPSLPVVILPLLLSLEGSQTRQLSSPPTRPSPLTTTTTPSPPVVILPQPQ